MIDALTQTLADDRGRWLLGERGQAQCELRLTGVLDGDLVDVAIDRTFVEGDVRWIVDYKTGAHEGADVAGFLDREEMRYRPQLDRYARLMRLIDTAGTRCASDYTFRCTEVGASGVRFD